MAFAIKEVLEAMAVMGSRAWEGETRHFTGPDNPGMHGLHLTADLRGCSTELPSMTDPNALRSLCLNSVRDAALQPVGELFHTFPGNHGQAGGVTGVVLLAESHLAVHTWPELGAVTLDVYVCNFGADNTHKAHALIDMLQAAFTPAQVERHTLERGRSE
jgi:S-adenosylmethionine decarboxylase